MNTDNQKTVTPQAKPLRGTITVPADKSISHRAAMFAALTGQEVTINNYSLGADCMSTLEVLKQLGVEVKFTSKNNIIVHNKNGFQKPEDTLYAGNSGTTMRLMAGILAGQDFDSVISGDKSLNKRPMARVIKPLKQMGADITAEEGDTKAPIKINGKQLNSIMYNSPVASAQVKSCILLAGMHSEDKTVVNEPVVSRNHTERLLSHLGANIKINDTKVSIKKSELTAKPLTIPGDISSAAFFIVAASIVPDSDITIKNVGLNPTRTGIIDVMRKMGADITILNEKTECNEEVGDLRIKYAELKAIDIGKEMIPRIIDEIPIIAIAATQAEGTTIVREAEELRHKESDRIKAVCMELKKMGADIAEAIDGFVVGGKSQLRGNCVLETYHDHRIAMSEYVAALVCLAPVKINEFQWVNISFPEFTEIFEQIR